LLSPINQKYCERKEICVTNPTKPNNPIAYEETLVKLENGSQYSGIVKNGMPNGFGKEYRQDGFLYSGYFRNGKWQGPGTIPSCPQNKSSAYSPTDSYRNDADG
jgi:hypothetical protein